jgi:hypothetical protein
MKTQIENPQGLHQRYAIKKIVLEKNPNYGAFKTIGSTQYIKHMNMNEFIGKQVDVDKDSEYFVMRLDIGGSDINHIKACRIGIHAYADAIESTIPQLAKDLRERYPLL